MIGVDHGWSRAITINDPRLSKFEGISITSGAGWQNTLPKPPINQWFHVAAAWAEETAAPGRNSTQYGCVYLNGQKGLSLGVGKLEACHLRRLVLHIL